VAKRLSSLSRKNKPDSYAGGRDFNNAILCAERPILTKKNKTEGADDLDAMTDFPGARPKGVGARLSFCPGVALL
jgi:hypothetical protein